MLPPDLMRDDEKIAPDDTIAQELRYVMNGRLVVAYKGHAGSAATRYFGIGHYAVTANAAESRCEAVPMGLDPDADAKMGELLRTGKAKHIPNQTFPINAATVEQAFERFESSYRDYRHRIGSLQTTAMRLMGERKLAAQMADAQGGKLVVN